MTRLCFSEDPRGSIWHRWDPHIHAPGTLLNDQYKGSDPWHDFLHRIESADPSIGAIGITDYYSIATYEEVIARKKQGRLANVHLIFPNVEMRFGIETAKGAGINVHFLFSPEHPDHVGLIKRFLSDLHFQFKNESYRCEASDLIRLGRAYDPSIKADNKALQTGTLQFKVNLDELRDLWNDSAWVQQNALIAVAGGSTDGTSSLKQDSSFAALRQEIERSAHIVFSSQPQQREFWLGKGAVPLETLEATWGGASHVCTVRTRTPKQRSEART